MEKYLGVKLVKAEPQSLDQYAGAKNPNDLSKLAGTIDQEGYKVVYEDGYTSWIPKDVFDKAYRKIKLRENMLGAIVKSNSYQERVYDEMCELDEKVEKLDKFINSNDIFNTLKVDEQVRLQQQLLAMKYYLTILVERIERF